MPSVDGLPLLLRADYLVIPRGEHEVYLYLEGGTSVHVRAEELDLAGACGALVKGATQADLERYGASGVDRAAIQEAVRDLVAALRGAGVLQQEVPAPEIDAAELDRFRTHAAYFSRFETEDASRFDLLRRVRRSHVLLLGVGGLGAATLPHLVGAGLGKVTCVDADVLEAGDLGRQTFFGEDQVGMKKVEAAAAAARRLSSYTEVVPLDQEVGSAGDIEQLIAVHGPVDLVVQAADRPIWDLTKFIAQAALTTGVPSLHASYLGVGPLHVPGASSCPACMLPRAQAQIENADEIVDYYRALDRQGPPRAVLPTSLAHFGVFMAHEAVAFLAGEPAPRTLNALLRLFINGEPSSMLEELPPDPRCPVCHGAGAHASAVPTMSAYRVAAQATM